MQSGVYPMFGTPRRDPIGHDNYASQAQYAPPLMFSKRNERIDWRRIASIDLDRIARDIDIQTLQDNVQQITFCDIDAEVDRQLVDPKFLTLFKLSQFIIEYLLICQDQISNQLGSFEKLQHELHSEKTRSAEEIERLKVELTETKKESKKRRKMLETQQRMLLAQNSNYHTCPVCTHAFLSYEYLEAHIGRRHPDYRRKVKPEHDVESEKAVRHLRDELGKKEAEVKIVRNEKKALEGAIKDYESKLERLTEENRNLNFKLNQLNTKLSESKNYRPTTENGNSSAIEQLRQENIKIRKENEDFKFILKEEQSSSKRYLDTIEKLEEKIESMEGSSRPSKARLSDRKISERSSDNENGHYPAKGGHREDIDDEYKPKRNSSPHVNRREILTHEPTKTVTQQTASPTIDRIKHPIKPKHLHLSKYCTMLTQKIREDPNFLKRYRKDAEDLFIDELEGEDGVGIFQTQTSLNELEFRTKFDAVESTRQSIRNDLPNFERIRKEIDTELTKIIGDYYFRRSNTSIRSTGSRSVKFEDERKQIRDGDSDSISSNPPARQPTHERNPSKPTQQESKKTYEERKPGIGAIVTTHFSKPGKLSESEEESESQESQSTGVRQPPRANLPTLAKPPESAVGALVSNMSRPLTQGASSQPPMQVKKARRVETSQFSSDDDRENSASKDAFNDKRRKIEEKLQQAQNKPMKPSINALPQGFVPDQRVIADQSINDEEDNGTLTTIHTNNYGPKSLGDHRQTSVTRHLVGKHLISSGDLSSNTYDSALKSNDIVVGREHDLRRPATADSAKTSNFDSDPGSYDD